MSASKGPRFGDIGVEASGDRLVMWVAPDRAVILWSDVSEEQGEVGKVTYEVMDTKWGDPHDLEIAESLKLHTNNPNSTWKLLK